MSSKLDSSLSIAPFFLICESSIHARFMRIAVWPWFGLLCGLVPLLPQTRLSGGGMDHLTSFRCRKFTSLREFSFFYFFLFFYFSLFGDFFISGGARVKKIKIVLHMGGRESAFQPSLTYRIYTGEIIFPGRILYWGRTLHCQLDCSRMVPNRRSCRGHNPTALRQIVRQRGGLDICLRLPGRA
jgi:hypothetical protein